MMVRGIVDCKTVKRSKRKWETGRHDNEFGICVASAFVKQFT